MPSYLSLINWTDQGIRNVKDSANRLDMVKQGIKAAGGRLIFFYMTMGQHDLATLMEFPNDDAAAKFALELGMAGNVRTSTSRAFTEDEYRRIIGSL
jgi:uncharacterized protein with GYD domain